MDYLATGRIEPAVAEAVIGGVAKACRENGCALLGGETAEMPGFYAAGEYDLAGFIVGAVDRSRLITGSGIRAGDTLIGIPSSGLHTNGYSLARTIAFELLGLRADSHVADLGMTVADALLLPHRSYLPVVRPSLHTGSIKGMAHITGGGITDNLPRILPLRRPHGRCQRSSAGWSSLAMSREMTCGGRSIWGSDSSSSRVSMTRTPFWRAFASMAAMVLG
jgi:phosphoribosylformylglycinamidine cyclo-ligase